MRSLAALLSLAAAYVLLRGHPETWPAVVRACVAVVCLFGGLGCWAVARRPDLPVLPSRRRARLLDSIALGAVVLAVEVGFLAYFHTAPEPLEQVAAKVEEWLRPEAAAKRRLEEQRESESRGGNWLWNHEGERPLPRRTNFKPGNRPEVFLQPSADAGRLLESRVYVHAFAMARYDDSTWAPLGGGDLARTTGNDGWLRVGGAPRGEPVSYRVFLGREPHGQNPLVGVQGLAAVRLPGVRERAPGHLLLPETDGGGYEYDAVSRPRTLDEVDPMAVPGRGLPDGYLDLPNNAFGSRIARFTDAVTGGGLPVARLKQIRTNLRTTLEYSLVTENPDNRDPMENFLFEEQRGHCEFFATAGALMARAVGVPSRICYGWTGGTYYEGSGLFVFRAREAHAWVEVFLEGEGWVVLDPTPPTALERLRPEVAPPDAPPPGMDEVEMDEISPDAARPLPWLLGLVAFGLFPVVLLWPMRRRRPESAVMGGGGKQPAYGPAFASACRRRGVRWYPGRTLRSMLEALGDPPEFAGDLIAYHYGVRYEGGSRDRERERLLGAKIREWDAQFRE
ncbi:transglutaminase family protein [Haloferula sp. A504]|uniref:transglutaminase family protein n=1 Tax=Haloferula sp. A504 TaxID=3373601 RepID=UPI0031BD0F7C|nr:transglutaminase-like domain-containing protein [Verrucomicrobiaceae bacterium E54]